MPKTLKIDGASGVIMIGDSDIDIAGAIANPFNHLTKLNFHSNLPYLQLRHKLTVSASFPALGIAYATFDVAGGGGKC